MPDADEADRQDMQKEAPQKLLDAKLHHALLVVMGRIAPAKAHLSVRHFDESVIRDGDAMRVIAQVLENVFRATKWSFGVDDPIMAAGLAEEGSKGTRCGQILQLSREMQFAGSKGSFKGVEELAAKGFRHCLDRKKKVEARPDPAGAVWRNTAFWNHRMYMWMMLQFLIPGMENAEKADLGAKKSWIACEFHQGCGTEAEQQGVDGFLVGEGQRPQFVRQGENQVHVAHGQ